MAAGGCTDHGLLHGFGVLVVPRTTDTNTESGCCRTTDSDMALSSKDLGVTVTSGGSTGHSHQCAALQPSPPPLSHSPVHLSTHALDCLSNHPSIPHMYPPICPCISLPTDPSSFQRSGGAKGRACREVSRASDEMGLQGYGPSPACSFSMASPVSSPCSLCLWLHSSFYVFFPSRCGRHSLLCPFPLVLLPLNLFDAQSCLRHFCPPNHHVLRVLSTDHQIAIQVRIVQPFLPSVSGVFVFIFLLISHAVGNVCTDGGRT